MMPALTSPVLVLQVRQAVRDGYDVRGYFYWTLIECARVANLLFCDILVLPYLHRCSCLSMTRLCAPAAATLSGILLLS